MPTPAATATATATAVIGAVPPFPPGMLGHFAMASFAATAVAFSSVYCWTALIHHEYFQVLALSVGSIIGVAVAAGILIYIPELVNDRHRSPHRGRRRGRGRTRHRTRVQHRHNNNNNSNNNNQIPLTTSRSRERLNQNEYPTLSSSATIKSSSSSTTTTNANASRNKTPSLPPLQTSQPRSSNVNYNNTPGRLPVSTPGRVTPLSNTSIIQRSKSPSRRYSSPPCLPTQPSSLSQYCLNPIVERKLEETDYDDFWWNELDSRTQYYALILGYTQVTWDEDVEIEELPCEDWYWDEMTNEQRAAAQHFGYDKETWVD